MALVDDSTIAGKITTLFGDNTTKAISEADLREVANDINDSKANKTYVDALVVGLWDDRGNFDASVNSYPSSGGSGTSGAIKKGDIWTVSVGGTLPTGKIVEPGFTVRALVDTPGNTEANWAIVQGSKRIVRSFKKTLSQAQITAAGNFAIAECPAVAGHHWEVLSASAKVTGQTTGYDAANIGIGAEGAPRYQFSDEGNLLSVGSDNWLFLNQYNASNGPQTNIISNAGLELIISDPSTAGDGTLTVYGTAELYPD